MIKRINKYLLTHYPLTWNTRVVWVTVVSLLVHILFFVSGFVTATVDRFQEYYDVSSVGGAQLYMFSILLSVAIIIVWLVYLLRNNAFKQFYIIDRFYLVKQFIILVWCGFISINFYNSFQWGVQSRARSITSEKQLVYEVNTMNLAMGFVPTSKSSFFILNKCDSIGVLNSVYENDRDYADTTLSNYYDSTNVAIREAIKLPGAFSYRNYCSRASDVTGYDGLQTPADARNTRLRFMDLQQRDSVKTVIDRMLRIADKYHISYLCSAADLTALVFADSLHSITRVIANGNINYSQPGVPYFSTSELERALSFIDHAHSGGFNLRDDETFRVIEAYLALCFAILLLCYRIFTRRVFLISIIGTLVWSIVVGLFSMSSGGEGGLSFLLFLFAATLLLAWLLMSNRSGRTWSGVNLNWHVYLLPFVLMIIMYFVQDAYRSHVYQTIYYDAQPAVRAALEAKMQADHPIGYWVSEHESLIMKLNLIFVFLYVCAFFTKLGRRWQMQPEE